MWRRSMMGSCLLLVAFLLNCRGGDEDGAEREENTAKEAQEEFAPPLTKEKAGRLLEVAGAAWQAGDLESLCKLSCHPEECEGALREATKRVDDGSSPAEDRTFALREKFSYSDGFRQLSRFTSRHQAFLVKNGEVVESPKTLKDGRPATMLVAGRGKVRDPAKAIFTTQGDHLCLWGFDDLEDIDDLVLPPEMSCANVRDADFRTGEMVEKAAADCQRQWQGRGGHVDVATFLRAEPRRNESTVYYWTRVATPDKGTLSFCPYYIYSCSKDYIRETVTWREAGTEGGFCLNECKDPYRFIPQNGRATTITYYSTGEKKRRVEVLNGNPDGHEVTWHTNGTKIREGDNKDGVPTGTWYRWSPGGAKIAEEEFQAVLHGASVRWHENGQKKSEGTYVHGKRTGPWVLWHDNGVKAVEARFEEDAVVSAKCWNQDGEDMICLEEWQPRG